MEDAASTLGCGTLRRFRRVLLPLLMPGIALSFSISFLISASEYFPPF
jgi:ABC-type Fe3+ transport system permease subunit